MSKNKEVEAQEVATEEKAPKAPKVEIIRGRMPVQVVKMIRYHSDADMTKSAIAGLYRTTVGKINDVMAGNNFGYVGEDFKPTAGQIEDAKAYIEQCNNEGLTKLVGSFEAATDDEAAGFEEVRKSTRKARVKKDIVADDSIEAFEEDEGEVIEDDEELFED